MMAIYILWYGISKMKSQPRKIVLKLSPKVIFLLINLAMSISSGEIKAETSDHENAVELEKTILMAAGIEERDLEIGLVDCIAYALKNNSEILIKNIEPRLKEGDVKIARAGFKPTFNIDYNLRENTKPSSSALTGANVPKYTDMDFNAGLSGKLITGTEYNIDFINEKYKSNSSFQSVNPYYAVEPKITILQPLFRDSGVVVNTADISIAQNNKARSQEDFKDIVMDVVTRTRIIYYNYIYYLENYAIVLTSLLRARDLQDINRARYQKGLLSSIDLLEAETATLEREKALITAEADLKKSEDDLKLITNLVNDPELWNAKIELIDSKVEFKEERHDLFESLKNAFVHRPDYNSAKMDLKSRDIKIVTAKNALLPTVDLVASFGLNGLGKDYGNSLEKIDFQHKDWSIGVKVDIPLGGAEAAKLNQRSLEKAQALMSFKRLEQTIVLEVRDKVRAIDIQARQVEASRLARETEEKNYRAQQERYAAGEISTHDMMDYEEKFARAELDYIKALIDYNIALVSLDKTQGLTLARNNIKLEE